MKYRHLPPKQGLYDPAFEHDSCGVGFVCNVNGIKSHDVVRKGIQVLERMSHRGAVGSDPKTGDGAGVLLQFPHEFYIEVCRDLKIQLPAEGKYGTGIIFLPREKSERDFCENLFLKFSAEKGLKVLGWRDVPVNSASIGEGARETEPVIRQVFISGEKTSKSGLELERKLYIVRKEAENAVRSSDIKQKKSFYVTNISTRTVIYKGLLMPYQVNEFYRDLSDERLTSSLILVHSRYSTNTFPTWDLAQPFRFLAHNGEINTLRGNINWMQARESLLDSEFFGKYISSLKPVLIEGQSDSAIMDNMFELLLLAGRSLEHSMMMLIPGAWEKDRSMDRKLVEFYKYHSCLMEPWDGPAAIAFTDGSSIGAVLDRNGLRPARYIFTKSGYVIMSSEVGVLDIEPKDIAYSGRLEPGKIFFIDTKEKRIISDKEIKEKIASGKPYGDWNREYSVNLADLAESNGKNGEVDEIEVLQAMKVFGYTREDLKVNVIPMSEEGAEPTGSMGNDIPPAVLSNYTEPLFDYFRQLFAQVTNPAIDAIREELVMSLEARIGRQGNILEEKPDHAKKLVIDDPILTNDELEKIRHIDVKGFKTKTISILFKAGSEKDFVDTIDRICATAVLAIKDGYTFIILSDKGINKDKAPLPSLMAVSAVHNHLIKKELRTSVGLILESGEPREVHHFAVIFGYGADAVNPYLAYKVLAYLIDEGQINADLVKAKKNYRKAIDKGLLKVISKMGISTLRSYKGAQIFEALGLGQDVIDKCFAKTVSRIGGARLGIIAKESIIRHNSAYMPIEKTHHYLNTGGKYQWQHGGEYHMWNPETIALLQDSVRNEDYSIYKQFAQAANDQSRNPASLRALLQLKKCQPRPLSEVEPASNIVKRFVTGAMSFGSISRDTHESIAIAMNRLGGKSNTGEGGEDPARFLPRENGDSARSAVKQVASGRFGVNSNYLTNADELQIKIAQGAKPGEGGQLPGFKVSAVIAKTRYTTAGVTLISPPPHHDIYSIEDLAQLIFDLKNSNPRARVSVKLVSEVGVGTIAAGVAKGHADMILISGCEGGTGASPRSSIMYAGLPWELGISETHQTLVLNDLRSRVRLQTDGQLKTGKDLVVAAILGAEEFGFCTSVLITLGCIMLRHCHLNNCSVGVATQDMMLEKRFKGKPEYVVNFMNFVAENAREIMASLGVRSIDELIGRTDLLEVNKSILPWKAKDLDLSRILYKPEVGKNISTLCTTCQDHNIDKVMDRELIKLSKPAIDSHSEVNIKLPIRNTNRAVGAMLSNAISLKYGDVGLPDDTIKCRFKGTAGQSFGAFLAKGVTFELEGMANDYVGKGLSGGKLIIYPDRECEYKPEENIIIGNTTFYGAISGEAYIRGMAGERFCIRNSGLYAVVEGVGDHGCEYMTGGRIVVLGKTGRNFGAGMSGGIAYVYDEHGDFKNKCNMEMITLENIIEEDLVVIADLLKNHTRYTGSERSRVVLDDLTREKKKFVKIMPVEYKKIIGLKAVEEKLGLMEVSDV